MAESIGNANVSITVALEELRSSLDQAVTEVNNSIESMQRDIVLNVDTKIEGQLQDNFKTISESIKTVQNDFDEASTEIVKNTEVIDDVLVKTGESFAGVTAEAGAMGGIAPLLLEFAAPISVALLAVAALAVEIKLLIEFVSDIKDRIKEYASENGKLKDTIETVTAVLSELWDGMVRIYDMVVDKIAVALIDLVEGFIDTWNEMNNTTGAGDTLLGSLKNLMSSGFEAIGRVVDAVIQIFAAFSGQSGDSTDKVDNLSRAIETLTGFFNGVAFVVDMVSKGFQVLAGWATTVADKLEPVFNLLRNISSYVTSIPGSILGGIFGGFGTPAPGGDTNASQTTERDDYKSYGSEFGPGTQEGKNTFNQQNLKKSPGGSNKSSVKSKEEDPEKAEADALKEIISLNEKLLRQTELDIENGKTTLQIKDELINKYILALQAAKETAVYDDNILDINIKIGELQLEQKKDLEDVRKLEEDRLKSQEKLIGLAGKESLALKEGLRQNVEAEKQLHSLMLLNSNNINKIELDRINEKYRKERENINQSGIAERLRIQIISQLEISRIKEIRNLHDQETENMIGFMVSKFSEAINLSSVGLKDVFTQLGAGIRSMFAGIFDEIMRRLLELAASAIFKSILKILSPGGGGLFGFLGSLFDRGGYTGDGPEDEIAGAVHRKEFVVNALGTSIPGNRELLEAANQGVDIKSLLGSAESGRTRLEGVKSGIIQSVGDSIAGSNDKIINISIDGVNVNTKIQKLTGLSESDWINIVDEELIPQLSKGLKRVGLPVLDNSIKN